MAEIAAEVRERPIGDQHGVAGAGGERHRVVPATGRIAEIERRGAVHHELRAGRRGVERRA